MVAFLGPFQNARARLCGSLGFTQLPSTQVGDSEMSVQKDHARIRTTISHGEYREFQDSPRAVQKPWEPLWLLRSTLLVFVSLFIALLLAAGLLFNFSQRNNGLATEVEENSYAWRYGPTAVFVTISAFWHQVNHAVKVQMPWTELQNGPSSAKKTILLDYTFPILPVALRRAIRNRHWVVVASTLGHLLMLVMIVFSTALFQLGPMEMTASFDFQPMNEIGLVTDQTNDTDWLTTPAAHVYAGIHMHGLPYPPGTSDELVFPRINDLNTSVNVQNYTIPMDGFQLQCECEQSSTRNHTWIWDDSAGSRIVADVEVPGCSIPGVEIAAGPTSPPGSRWFNTSRNVQARFEAYECNTGNGEPSPALDDDWSDPDSDRRFLLAVTDVEFDFENRNPDDRRFMQVNQATVALCKVSYAIHEFDVYFPNNNGSTHAVRHTSDSSRRQLPGLTDNVFARAITLAFGIYWDLGFEAEQPVRFVPYIFDILLLEHNMSNPEPFLDPPLLLSGATRILRGASVQLIRELALKATTSGTVTGNITWIINRLRVSPISTAILCTSLSLLVLITAFILVCRPRLALPFNPDSTAAIASVLSYSPRFNSVLRQVARLPKAEFAAELDRLRFRTFKQASGAISIIVDSEQESGMAMAESSDQPITETWWTPIAARHWFVAAVLLLPLMVIAALEIVQSISDNSNGFVNLASNMTVGLASYIPAAFALAISALYSSFDSVVCLFAPYSALRQGVPLDSSVLGLSFVGKMAPHLAYLAVRSNVYVILSTALANSFGSFLTILAANLYGSTIRPQTQQVVIHQRDQIEIGRLDGAVRVDREFQASKLASLIELRDLNYTKWTYDGLVFSQLETLPSQSTDPEVERTINIQIPAIRARLNCTTIPTENRRASPLQDVLLTDEDSSLTIPFSTELDPTEWCNAWSSRNSTQSLSWNQEFTIPLDGSEVLIGRVRNLIWLPDHGIFESDGYGVTPSPPDNTTERDHGCPRVAVTLGRARSLNSREATRASDAEFETDFGTLLCYQNLEQVETQTIFKYPSYDIDASLPPQVDETRISHFRNRRDSTRFGYEPVALMDGEYAPRWRPDSSNDDLDLIMYGLAAGREKCSLDDMAGERNTEHLYECFNHFYSRAMAQAISMLYRSDIDETSATDPFEGTLTTRNGLRLSQNAAPKLALQVILGLMVLCAIVSRLLLPLRKLLQHNPSSIYGKALLLFGGSLAPEGVASLAREWNGDPAAFLVRQYHRGTVKLQWWEGINSQRYGIDIDLRTTELQTIR
ncbi:hypothetical protein B0I35DRAFT_400873 [Stachybotrys elegans]|uniref:Uncharacterized protein n=1 Tax=Stachybotrys elegans TaxID=80388 RepID=A0A8K0WK26_9HYPO|nr:hypothetical protein B0I35DRAFT_400873 [Stachybotrys elegans]